MTNGNSAAFGFNSPGNNLATFECSIDGGAFGACTSPKSYTNLAVGSHTFAVRATNQVGTDRRFAGYAHMGVASSATRTPSLTTAAGFDFRHRGELRVQRLRCIGQLRCRLDGGRLGSLLQPEGPGTGLAVGDHTLRREVDRQRQDRLSPASTSWTVTTRAGSGRSPGIQPVAPKASLSKPVKVGKGVRSASSCRTRRQSRIRS